MPLFLTLLAVASLVLAIPVWRKHTLLRRESFIRTSELPRGLFDKLKAKHPQLSTKDCQLVAHGLRQFFLAHLKSGRQYVSMPSQVVDDLWHEFILCTKSYELFCRGAFGRFLHHTPAVILGGVQRKDRKDEGLRRCWWFVCKDENINPRAPTRLPLLFALDAKLNVVGGFRYVPDCSGVRREGAADGASSPYCGADFASDGAGGGVDGFADAASDGGGGSSDGCGGGGCGGD